MSLKITVTVESSSNSHTTTFTRTCTDGNDNPRFYGDCARRNVAILGNEIGRQLDRLTDKPLTADR
jgi:hypothetical protein